MLSFDQIILHAPALLAATPPASLAIDLMIVLAAAAVVAVALNAIGVSAIPGYLIAGTLIGPSALGLVAEADRIDGVAELAVVLLLFGIGLHLDIATVKRGAWSFITVGVGSTLVAAGLIALAAMAFGLGFPAAAAIGMSMAMSSTAVVLRVIQDRRELHRSYGRLSFGVLVMQDLLVIGAIAMIPMLAPPEAEQAADAAATAEGSGLAAVLLGGLLRLIGLAALLIGGRLVLPRVLVAIAKKTGHEVMLVASFAVALALAVVCSLLGLSAELGAFIAGFLLSSTPLRFQLGGQLAPLRDLFMAVFFTAVGLKLDLVAAAGLWWAILLGTAIVIALKALAIGGAAWLAGVPASTSAQTGFTLAQAGEFSFVVLGVAAGAGLLMGEQESAAVAVVALSLIVTPALMGAGRRAYNAAGTLPLAPWFRKKSAADTARPARSEDDDEQDPAAGAPRVVIAGYGPVGRACADRLDTLGVPFTIVELNTRTVQRQRLLGRSIIYGDVTNREVLLSAGVLTADAVLLTIPDDEAMLRACRECRRLNPRAFIGARAGVMSRGLQARELGADHVTVAEVATAEIMSAEVIKRLGTGPVPA